MQNTKNEWFDLVKGLLLLSTLLSSGAGLGYWYKGTERDQDHVEEIARLQANHFAALDVLSGRISRAADQVTAAADAAADAAQTADKAATVADKAATVAGKAANKASSPVVITTPAPSKADNRAINQAVQQANQQLRK